MGLGAASLFHLGGCSGSQVLKTQTADFRVSEDDSDDIGDGKRQSDVFLDEKGLPSQKDLMKPGPLGEKWLGAENAPVTMIKYASLTCPFCRVFHLKTYPDLKKQYINTGKIRYILREFPIGHSSGAATIVMRCLGQDNTKMFFALYDKFITQQQAWVSLDVRRDAIYQVASQVGITRKQFDTCFENQEIIEGLKWVKQRGRDLGVTGTPTFFINGKKKRSVITLDDIREMAGSALA
ncbi:MAG: DsbA family protein [Pseudomonadota bacterium]